MGITTMRRKLILAALCGAGIFAVAGGPTLADQHESDSPGIVPVELYVCNYNEGQGPGDLDRVVARWNSWMDENEAAPYSAWTLTPFYFSEEQEFDFIWLGVAPDGETLGKGQDLWLGKGQPIQADFDKVAPCGAHLNFASMNLKQSPEPDNSPNGVLTFSDCTIAEGKSFDDAIPALQQWAAYRGEHGSQAGMWLLFPAFGGGDADFDFKFVTGHANYASLGVDYDQYGRDGYRKAGELFGGVLDCDDARVYNAEERRDGMSADE